MLDLRRITLASIVYNDNPELLARTWQVMAYCLHHANFHSSILFTPRYYKTPRTIQIPVLTHDSFQTFVAKGVEPYIKSDFLMWVHEDGFPLHWDLWRPEFLDYDFVGAPWTDQVVGNDGFSLISRPLLSVMKYAMSWHDGQRHSDEWLCRDNEMERYGLKRAPFTLAKQFSVESRCDDAPAFGFHNRNLNPELYRQGWAQIQKL